MALPNLDPQDSALANLRLQRHGWVRHQLLALTAKKAFGFLRFPGILE